MPPLRYFFLLCTIHRNQPKHGPLGLATVGLGLDELIHRCPSSKRQINTCPDPRQSPGYWITLGGSAITNNENGWTPTYRRCDHDHVNQGGIHGAPLVKYWSLQYDVDRYFVPSLMRSGSQTKSAHIWSNCSGNYC